MGVERTDAWLGKVFTAADSDAQTANYDGWAETYDEDIRLVGYLTPSVVAGLLCRFVPPEAGAVLDAGCGTGLAGEILSALGYAPLVGIDMSEGMLARAEARGVYAALRRSVLGEPLDFADGAFAGCTIAGVFNAGHAPAKSLDELVRVVRPGGVLTFNIGAPAWEAGFAAKVATLSEAGRVEVAASTQPYRSMPLSVADGQFTARGFALRVR